jgi:hypothetical protein
MNPLENAMGRRGPLSFAFFTQSFAALLVPWALHPGIFERFHCLRTVIFHG